MPFDGPDSAEMRRGILIAALRSEMPPHFTWNFCHSNISNNCGSQGCAIGLAQVLWPERHVECPDRLDGKHGEYSSMPVEIVRVCDADYRHILQLCGMQL